MLTRRSRLALSYLAVIMAISIFFSGVIYYVAVGEADRGLRRQETSLRDNLYFVRPEKVAAGRDAELRSYRNRIITRLVFVNLGMLALATALSYTLARRNLNPLEHALDAQARFTSDAAHELRTPLTAMKTETEVGLRDKRLSLPEARALLTSNLEELAKLETLTNALLRLAKNGVTPDRSSWKKLSVGELARDAADRIKSEAVRAGITIDLSDIGAEKVQGDRDQLVELLVILLDNAVKYGKSGSSVMVGSNLKNGRVEVRVKDGGIGIKQSDLPHIFERFYRADQSRNKTIVSGFGLGLSLAKQITDAHDGTINVTSEAGHGSTFTMTFPNVPISE